MILATTILNLDIIPSLFLKNSLKGVSSIASCITTVLNMKLSKVIKA